MSVATTHVPTRARDCAARVAHPVLAVDTNLQMAAAGFLLILAPLQTATSVRARTAGTLWPIRDAVMTGKREARREATPTRTLDARATGHTCSAQQTEGNAASTRLHSSTCPSCSIHRIRRRLQIPPTRARGLVHSPGPLCAPVEFKKGRRSPSIALCVASVWRYEWHSRSSVQ